MSQARRDDSVFKRWKRIGKAIEYLGFCFDGDRDISVDIVGFSARAPKEAGGEVLVVVRGLDEEGAPVVAFSSAFELGEALVSLEARILNGTLKWRPDEWSKQ